MPFSSVKPCLPSVLAWLALKSEVSVDLCLLFSWVDEMGVERLIEDGSCYIVIAGMSVCFFACFVLFRMLEVQVE